MKKAVWLALNAKYSHTSLAVRYLRQAVPGSEILELTINDHLSDILGEVYDRQPEVLGIACYIWNIELVKDLLRLLAEAMPELTIICGGPEVSYEVEEFLREFPMVDFVVRGEGEQALAALAACDYEPDHEIGGVAWRDAGGRIHAGQAVTVPDITRLPFPYTPAELADEDFRERILYYETSRGCPFACAYCLSCATAGVRYLPLARVQRELEAFVAADVRQVKFVDRTFNANKKHFLPILRYIDALPRSCRTNFHFEIAVDYMDDEALELLARMPAGRVQLEIGIQSTNKDTLAAVARVNHWSDIAGHIGRLHSFHNIHIHTDLIIGLPGEGMASFRQSFNDVYDLHSNMLQLGFLKFLKGARMMELVERYGYAYMPVAPYEVIHSDALSYGEIHWLHLFEDVFERYHNAGRCRYTAQYLIERFEQGDAFAFWQKLTDWWRGRCYHRRGHSTAALYGYMQSFVSEQYGLPGGAGTLIAALLRYDALRADGGSVRSGALDWNGKEYQSLTAPFWRSDRPRRYIPGYRFPGWRRLQHMYQIEVFPYRVQPAGENGQSDGPAPDIEPVRQALLFDYTSAPLRIYDVTAELEGRAGKNI